MIKFSLKCDRDHRFESWFQSADAFDRLSAGGLLSCTICGSHDIDKALMAPRVQASRETDSAPGAETAPAQTTETPPSPPPSEIAKALKEFRKHVESTSEYVGGNFVAQARDMHDGLAPHRPIYGEAKPEEARKLAEDGVPVAPLPFVPSRKSN